MAQTTLDRWVAVLSEQASDLVPVQTITEEAESVSGYLTT